MSVDLSRLPPPAIIEPLSYEQIYSERKRLLIEKWPTEQQTEIAELLEIESEPLSKLLQENAYRELLLRQRINEALLAVLVSHTSGNDADNLFAFYDVERKEGETDDQFRERALLSLHALSTAGPSNAYRYYALTVEGVYDAQIERLDNGFVHVWVLGNDHEVNETDQSVLLSRVHKTLSADDVRPLSDTVTVDYGVVEDYEINAVIYLDPSTVNDVDLKEARRQLESYVAERFKLGSQVSVSGIYAALHQPGVLRVDINDLHLPATVGKAYYCNEITLEVER